MSVTQSVPTVSVSLVAAVQSAGMTKWTAETADKKRTHFFRDLEADGKARRAAGRTPKQAADKLQKLLGDLARQGTPQAAAAVQAQSVLLGESIEWARCAAQIAAAIKSDEPLRPAANGDKRGVTGATIIARLFGAESQASVSAALGW